jgi:TatD DNase family protein
MVVNGSCEADWPDVLELARRIPQVLPSFGYHPWYVGERTKNWREMLLQFLGAVPSAVGEIGLDRWINNYDWEAQQEVFTVQMQIAAERNLPASIHCLQAWGRLLKLLENGPRPARGFLLHSYGGPPEMVEFLAEMGAYFSLPGYFAHERKVRQRETFQAIPVERLLVETDAPDQLIPEPRVRRPLEDTEGKPINHPGNILAVYQFAAELRHETIESLACQVEKNFTRLFGTARQTA